MLCPVTGVTPRGRRRGRKRAFLSSQKTIVRSNARRRTSVIGGITENSFQLKEFLEALFAPFSPVARLLVTSETAREVDPRAVDVYIAGSNAPGDPAGALQITRCYKARQPIASIVGDSYRILLIFIGDNAENGSENFLACDGHVVANAREYGWLDEITFRETIGTAGTSRDQLCPFGNALSDEALHLLELGFAGKRSDAGSFGERIANFGCLSRLLRGGYHLSHFRTG